MRSDLLGTALDRLDVLERSATPDMLMLGHITAARIAAVLGMEHRALDLCEALLAAGEQRALPRVCMAALGEQIRLHAARERADTCGRLHARLLACFETELAAMLAPVTSLRGTAVAVPV